MMPRKVYDEQRKEKPISYIQIHVTTVKRGKNDNSRTNSTRICNRKEQQGRQKRNKKIKKFFRNDRNQNCAKITSRLD